VASIVKPTDMEKNKGAGKSLGKKADGGLLALRRSWVLGHLNHGFKTDDAFVNGNNMVAEFFKVTIEALHFFGQFQRIK